MKIYIQYCLFTLYLAVLLISCQESSAPTEARYRLKKVATRYSNPVLARYDLVFNYTNGKNLANYIWMDYSINDTTLAIESSRTTYFYDQQGRAIKAETKSPQPSSRDYYFTYVFGYDSLSRIKSVKFYNQYYDERISSFLEKDYQYDYGAGADPIRLTAKVNTGSQFDPFSLSVYDFTFHQGNITAITLTELPVRTNGYQKTISQLTYMYDDKLYPYYQLVPYTYCPSLYIWDRLSKNNRLYDDEVYSYDNNGLLVKSVSPTSKSIVTYTYETY